MADLALRIAQISDTHISRYGQFVEKMFDVAAREINRLEPRPDVVVHSGDLTDIGVLADYELALEKMKLLKAKVVIAPGNHDERNYGQSLFKEIIGPMDYEVKVGNAIVFISNSPQPDRDDGRLGRRRQDYLEEKLRALPSGVIKILVFHHHLVPVPYSGREANVLEDAGDVLEMVLKHKINFVLMGHRHVTRVLRINGTVLVNAGTTSSARTRGRLGHSFNLVDIFEDGAVEVTERNLTQRKTIPIAKYTGPCPT